MGNESDNLVDRLTWNEGDIEILPPDEKPGEPTRIRPGDKPVVDTTKRRPPIQVHIHREK